MPEIKIKQVVSCSTEDTTHKADNLLSSDTYRKWKAARPGEKQTSVILQFDKEEQVHSIDIGNEGSAFIEVLVGHSTSIKDQDFEVLLVTSSFMSPSESRAGTNTNRVRFFGPQQLVKATAQEKWDRVKIVCSQPYSKTIAYGVAFIKFHSPPDKNDAPASTPPKLTKLGQFRVKDDSPSSGPSLQPGSLFFNRDTAVKDGAGLKVSPQNTKLSYAAAALKSESSTPNPKASSPQAPGKRKFEFSKERQEAPGPPPKKPSAVTSPQASPAPVKAKTSAALTPSPNTARGKAAASAQRNHEKVSKPKARSKTEETVPFNKIMEGVVFVLSGFQNPFRGELRDKALAMGGRYRPDWTPDSTHLICAFANTPKYSQVKACGGMIVRKEWVLDCHKRKQKISYRRYLMDGAESSSEDSDQEKSSDMRQNTPKKLPERDTAKAQDLFEGSTDDEGEDGTVPVQDDDEDSGMDTEDELRRVEVQRKEREERSGGDDSRRSTVRPDWEDDPYGGSTDENTDAEEEEDKPIPELPDFLTGKRFYLYGKFAENQRRLLQRYIVAFNGVLEDYMSEKVQFVITSQGWDDAFEDALLENESLSFVKPSWIFAINDRQKVLPYQPYTVVP
ncbi:LOW QUALITY PROTEIN: DNA repair protein XRCC1 [Brachyhypopomus gauderio]|uniref:LOW QUALITY PROTEIN: DNA repair protein XRCC1 n=1 Tax=Brachyhypopomus gauderio TaxID=698409 RepID=UPI004041586C